MSRNFFQSYRRRGFTLVELLVVICIVGILTALALSALRTARERAKVARCVSNLHQIYSALTMYLQDSNEVVFWKGADIDTQGMDWYVYGGRETGNQNTGQGGLFNNIIPRPLNKYLGNKTELFHCPSDTQSGPWGSCTLFESVGNSYNFNATGDPFVGSGVGLDAIRFSSVRDTARTVVFLDGNLVQGGKPWHTGAKVNVCFADGHAVFMQGPFGTNAVDWTWEP